MKRSLTAFALLASLSTTAFAQPYQDRQPIQLVVPFAAGGAVDIMARTFAKVLSAQLGHNVVVINNAGAGGTLGFWQVVRATANGYTLAYGPSTPITAGVLLSNGPKFDQLTPVCQAHENIVAVVVRGDSPFKTIQQLLAEAKAKPGFMTYGHAGTGTVPHLSMEHFGLGVGASFNAIAYRGDSPMVIDLIGARLDFGVSSISLPAGNPELRILAIFADQRQPAYPDVPAMKELGTETLEPGLVGLWAPTGTPADIVKLLETTCESVVKADEFQGAAKTLSQRPIYFTGERYRARVAADFDRLEKTIRALKLK